MSQNQLIATLAAVLLLVIAASAFVLLTSSPDEGMPPAPSSTAEPLAPANTFELDILRGQAYQLLNKQLVKEGALPVKPATATGKANPFL